MLRHAVSQGQQRVLSLNVRGRSIIRRRPIGIILSDHGSSCQTTSPPCSYPTQRFKSTIASSSSSNNAKTPFAVVDSLSKPPSLSTVAAVAPVCEDDLVLSSSSSSKTIQQQREVKRCEHIRNVGILAHVDAGKTTVTERLLELAGVVRQAGRVDTGNTVTDFLPAERERGITIQSAAISFPWGWHNNDANDSDINPDSDEQLDQVQMQLIDTPGHVDFSVEVNRSVAVLDGAVLVLDAVAGVQAQTETVWRAMTHPSYNNHEDDDETIKTSSIREPLPCLALINKMDKDGCHFGHAVRSIENKLPGANPIPIQLPLFSTSNSNFTTCIGLPLIPFLEHHNCAATAAATAASTTSFAGVIDLIHMRAVVYPDNQSHTSVEDGAPRVYPLYNLENHLPVDQDCPLVQAAMKARKALVEKLAEAGDERMEQCFLDDIDPTHAELRQAVRRMTLVHQIMPVLCGAALKGKGMEVLLDAMADFLPSPMDRLPPALSYCKNDTENLGHPLHPSLIALAFKVCHMKGRGGSGDGRVVFARIYSGKLNKGDSVTVISPSLEDGEPHDVRVERIGGFLELQGGSFGNKEGSTCRAGDVVALVGLKTVVTGDTLVIHEETAVTSSSGASKKKRKKKGGAAANDALPCLAGVAAPKPVLQVRVEAETSQQQLQLSEALRLLTIEDPSLHVQESDNTTLLSGLGELHIEVTLDRIAREFGLHVVQGAPAVAYRESIVAACATDGLVNYDRTFGDAGGQRLQAAVDLQLEPIGSSSSDHSYHDNAAITTTSTVLLSEPTVSVGPKVLEFLQLDPDRTPEELSMASPVYKALLQACHGALKRGPLGSYPMANLHCHINEIDAEDGLAGLQAMPGALRAATAHIISSTLEAATSSDSCRILEPNMSVEVYLPNDMVGNILSDLTSRRGTVGDVVMGTESKSVVNKALIRGQVPLIEILGYANTLRSLTGGEGSFSAEYNGHSVQ